MAAAGSSAGPDSPTLKCTKLYHEKQVAALCAQHCLNNLVQYPTFTVGDLLEYARALDERERQLMMSHGADTTDALKYLAEDSFNVDEAGNFSQGVLQEALSKKYPSLRMDETPETIDACMKNPTQFGGFILNSSDHWYSIRRIGGHYWNLNSTMKQPQHLSDFYLAAFLGQARNEGWNLFVITGKLPPSFEATSEGPKGSWHSIPELLAAPKQRPGGNRAGNGSAALDPDMEAALRASLDFIDTDSDKRMGFETSGGGGGQGPEVGGRGGGGSAAMTDDEQMEMALAMSMPAGGDSTGSGGGSSGGFDDEFAARWGSASGRVGDSSVPGNTAVACVSDRMDKADGSTSPESPVLVAMHGGAGGGEGAIDLLSGVGDAEGGASSGVVAATPVACAEASQAILASMPGLGNWKRNGGLVRVQAGFDGLWEGVSASGGGGAGALRGSVEARTLLRERAGAPVPEKATGRFQDTNTVGDFFTWVSALLLAKGFGVIVDGDVQPPKFAVQVRGGGRLVPGEGIEGNLMQDMGMANRRATVHFE